MTEIRSFYERIIWKILTWNNGQEIPASELEKLWEILREMLKKRGYRVEEIEMPLVKARVVESGEYERIGQIIDKLPNTRMNVVEEYGKFYTTESSIGTLVRPPGTENEYLILLSKSRSSGDHISTSQEMTLLPRSFYLCHELAHIWEHLLNVKPAGSLTKQILDTEDLDGVL